MIFLLILGTVLVTLAGAVRYRKAKSSHITLDEDQIQPISLDFKWEECEPLKLYPFVGKRNFRPSMGVKNISNKREDLFLIENTYLDCVRLREQNLQEFEGKLIHCNQNERSVAAVKELYEMTVDFMCKRYPQYFVVNEEKGIVINTITNSHLLLSSRGQEGRYLMRMLALNTEEDILIMLKDDPHNEDEEYILRASLTGLPAGFDPSHNFDQPISHIHEPVPQYGDRLKSPMHRFFNKLQPTDLWQRGNWSLQTNDEFFKIENHHGRDGDVVKELSKDDIDFDNGCFLRCERQLLTRLPKSRAVIMLVRTYLTPIKEIKAEGLGDELARGIESLPEDLAFYKRRGVWGKAVTDFLRDLQ